MAIAEYPYNIIEMEKEGNRIFLWFHRESKRVMKIGNKPLARPKYYDELIPELLANGWRMKYDS